MLTSYKLALRFSINVWSILIDGILLGADKTFDRVPIPVLKSSETNDSMGWTPKQLLNDARYQRTTWTGGDHGKEPCFKGMPLTKYLRNQTSSGTNDLTLDQMFTLKQVITGEEPEIVTYQVPINFDVISQRRSFCCLSLAMDSNPEDLILKEPELHDCKRATNGDCLLAWNTAFEEAGQHEMQALLIAETGGDLELVVRGRVKPYLSTNICQFVPAYSAFNDDVAYLYAAGLPEPNASYSIEIKTRSGDLVKTLSGQTTNGIIYRVWDLIDDHGHKYSHGFFNSFFRVTLSKSNRSQTLAEPQNKLGAMDD